MNYLLCISIIALPYILMQNYFYLSQKSSTIETVNKMGIGYNLANSLDCYNSSIKINEPKDQITLCGNPIPTNQLIKNLKKYGFKQFDYQ